MKKHSYSIEIRISGIDLVPAEVSKDLQLIPLNTENIGAKFLNRVRTKALWSYNGSSSGESLEWDSLEEGLHFVLDKLDPLTHKFNLYKEKYEIYWWCGHYQSSFDGGPSFSPFLLKRLSDFGVELLLDCYFLDQADEDLA